MDELKNYKGLETLFLESADVERLFRLMERTDYLLLYKIWGIRQKTGENRIYLATLADEMKLQIPEVSKAVSHLQEKGYIVWETDPERQRTYIELTSRTEELLKEQKKQLVAAYDKIRTQVPPEDLVITLQTMQRILHIVKEV